MINNSPSIIRINGKQISYTSNFEIPQNEINEAIAEASAQGMKVLIKPLKRGGPRLLSVSLFSATGAFVAQSHAYIANPSMWKEILPVFGVFQEISMIIGSLAIISGLIVMIFKKRLGWQIISTAGLVVLGCFLVPSAVMLVAIVGKLLNNSLSHAFEAFQTGVG